MPNHDGQRGSKDTFMAGKRSLGFLTQFLIKEFCSLKEHTFAQEAVGPRLRQVMAG